MKLKSWSQLFNRKLALSVIHPGLTALTGGRHGCGPTFSVCSVTAEDSKWNPKKRKDLGAFR
ncbi:hypothetical protein ABE29_19325 [Cytobacillus firmus]|nr:hypothetical protein [Cytobacillus firmus]MBG9550590.1 hypothetical protein [Cytobacillus firmus]MBG9554328.1 hypothetical protein [Cytobacillus firmus]MBG9558190.1 hypothetical protein [Cytobacillus firmus]MBG9574368.1 hypothetical protein [Cytobacillus firmus]